jgi:hypothetical protein
MVISGQPTRNSPELGIGQELDALQAPAHFIEYAYAALQQRATVIRELHALRAAVE